MKIKFNKYTYFNPNNDDNTVYETPTAFQKQEYAFKQEEFNIQVDNARAHHLRCS